MFHYHLHLWEIKRAGAFHYALKGGQSCGTNRTPQPQVDRSPLRPCAVQVSAQRRLLVPKDPSSGQMPQGLVAALILVGTVSADLQPVLLRKACSYSKQRAETVCFRMRISDS